MFPDQEQSCQGTIAEKYGIPTASSVLASLMQDKDPGRPIPWASGSAESV